MKPLSVDASFTSKAMLLSFPLSIVSGMGLLALAPFVGKA